MKTFFKYWTLALFSLGFAALSAQAATVRVTVENGSLGSWSLTAGGEVLSGNPIVYNGAVGEEVVLIAEAGSSNGFHWECPGAHGEAVNFSTKERITLRLENANYDVKLVFDGGQYAISFEPTTVVSVVEPSQFAGLSSGGKVPRGNYLKMRAEETWEGKVFVGWEVSPAAVVLSDYSSRETAFLVRQDTHVRAKYETAKYLLEVKANPAGIGGTVTANDTATGYYTAGSKPFLKAVPNAGFTFTGWTRNEGTVTFVPASAEQTVTLGAPNGAGIWSLTANFEFTDPNAPGLTVAAEEGGQVTVSLPASKGGGTTVVAGGATESFAANAGDKFGLLATPADAARHAFVTWEGSSLQKPVVNAQNEIIVNRASSVTAKFEAIKRNLTVRARLDGGGAVPAGCELRASDGTTTISSAGIAVGQYQAGTQLGLTAIPTTGYAFLKWDGLWNITPDNPGQGYLANIVTDTAEMGPNPAELTAVFVRVPEMSQLTVTAPTGGKVAIKGSYTDIRLNGQVVEINEVVSEGSQTFAFLKGTTVDLQATALSADYRFASWTDTPAGTVMPQGSVSAGKAQVVMNGDRTVLANFASTKGKLTVSIFPAEAQTAGATVKNVSTTEEIVGNSIHPIPSEIQLKAEVPAGSVWEFSHWSGDATGASATHSLQMTRDSTVVANFTRKYQLTVAKAGSGATNSVTGTGLYAYGAEAVASVSVADGSVLVGWTGDTGSASAEELQSPTLRLSMTQDRSVVAQVEGGKWLKLNVVKSTDSTGTISALGSADADAIAVAPQGKKFWKNSVAYAKLSPDGATAPSTAVGHLDVSGGGATVNLSAPEFLQIDGGIWRFKRWVGGDNDWATEISPNRNATYLVTGSVNGHISAVYTDQRQAEVDVYVDGVKNAPGAPSITLAGAPVSPGGSKQLRALTTAPIAAPTQATMLFSRWAGAGIAPGTQTQDATNFSVNATQEVQGLAAYYLTKRTVTVEIETEGGAPNAAAKTLFGNTIKAGGTVLGAMSGQRVIGQGETLTVGSDSGTGNVLTADGQTWRFKGWITDGGSTVNNTSASFTTPAVLSDLTLKAVFVRSYQLTILTDPSGKGTVTPTSGSYYDSGATVNLNATDISGSGYTFDEWASSTGATFTAVGGVVSPQRQVSITMGKDHTVTAKFKLGDNLLTVNVRVNGVLNPTPALAGMDFSLGKKTGGATANYTPGSSRNYNSFEIATIVANYNASQARFDSMTSTPGSLQNLSGNSAELEMFGDQSVTASFTTKHTVTLDNPVVLDATAGGSGGTETLEDLNGTLSGRSAVYFYNQNPQLSATPNAGYRFLRWEVDTDGDWGTVESTSASASFRVNVRGDIRARAVYAKEYTVYYVSNPTSGAGGTVNKVSPYTAYYGEKISGIVATPNAGDGYSFWKWTVSPNTAQTTAGTPIHDSVSNTTTLLVEGETVLTANFIRGGDAQILLTANIKLDGVINPVGCPLTVTAGDSSVPGEETASVLNGGQSKPYFLGDNPKLTANETTGYEFICWEDNNSPSVDRTINNIRASQTYTAIYRTKVTLTMAIDPAHIGDTDPAVGSHTSLPALGNLYLGMTPSINSSPSATYIDTYAFTGWSVNDGALPSIPTEEKTAVKLDVADKRLTAHYAPGHKLEVRVKYEDTANTGDTKSFTVATGTRTSVANGAGNKAGIYLSGSNSMDYAVRTLVVGASAQVRAVAAAPGYRFVGWTDSLSADTPNLGAGSVLDVTVDAPKTLTAIFEKVRVKLEIYTIPAGNPDVKGEALGGYNLVSGNDPRVYEVFYGGRPTLKATSTTPTYSFVSWFYGAGYTTDITKHLSDSAEITYPHALTDAVTRVTAYFLPHGLHRLVLFTDPAAEIDITNVNVPGAFSQTYTTVDGRPACVADVGIGDPYSEVAIAAVASVVGKQDGKGYGFYRWVPYPGYERALPWIHESFRNETKLNYPIVESELRLVATYGSTDAYRLTLSMQLTEGDIAVDPKYEGGFHELDVVKDFLGNVEGSTLDPVDPTQKLLFVNRTIPDKSAIFPSGHIESFGLDNYFQNGPFSINRWEYEKLGVLVDTGYGDAYTTTEGVASQPEKVTAFIDVNTHTVSLTVPVVHQPSEWSAPNVSGSGSFSFLSYDETLYPADVFLGVHVSPVPAPYLKQVKRAKTGSAPVLNASGTPAGFVFEGWDVTSDGLGDFTNSGFNWNNWPSAWKRKIEEDRVVTAIYRRKMDMTLKIVLPTPTSADKVEFSAPLPTGGITVDKETPGLSATKTYLYENSFSVVAKPEDNHVLEKWIVRKAKGNGGGTFDWSEEIVMDGTPGEKVLPVSLDFPTEVTAVFARQGFVLTVDVANSIDGAQHGKIKVDGTPSAGSFEEIRALKYSDMPVIEAIPDAGYEFKGWTVAPALLAAPTDAQAASTTVQVDGTKRVTAHFERKVTLTMAINPATLPGDLLVPAVGTYGILGGQQLTDGSQVSIEAGVDGGYDFVNWTVSDKDGARTHSLSGKNQTLTLEGNTVATANYAKLLNFTLSIPAGLEESRAVSGDKAGIGQTLTVQSNATQTRSTSYRENSVVRLEASEGQHFNFKHWKIQVGGGAATYVSTSIHEVTITDGTVVEAIFEPKNYTLTVTPFSTNYLTPIALSLEGASGVQTHDFLGAGATWTLPYKSSITLGTVPATHYGFFSWTEGGVRLGIPVDAGNPGGPEQPTLTIELTGSRTLVANYKRSDFLLTHSINPVGSGVVVQEDNTTLPSPKVYPADSVAKIKAVEMMAPGYGTIFMGWSGDTSGSTTAAAMNLPMDRDRTLQASFNKAVGLTLQAAEPVTGSVSLSGCSARRMAGEVHVFAEGDTVRIKATPAPLHYEFDRWEFTPAVPSASINSATTSFTITENVTATAHFKRKAYSLSAYVAVDGTRITPGTTVASKLILSEGTVSQHNFLTDGSTVARTYEEAEPSENLYAEAKAPISGARYRFEKWIARPSNTASVANPLGFVFKSDATYDANFLRQARITVRDAEDVTYGEDAGSRITLSGVVTPTGENDYDVRRASPQTVTVTATTPEGFDFVRWEGAEAASGNTVAGDGSKAVLTFVINDALAEAGDIVVTPLFKRKEFSVTIRAQEISMGLSGVGGALKVSPQPNVPGAYYGGTYYYGTTIDASVLQTSAGYRFVGWDLNGNGELDAGEPTAEAISFNVTGNHVVYALFIKTFVLTVGVDGDGTAVITDPAGVTATPAAFDAGTVVSLKAAPNAGTDFLYWIGQVASPDAEETTITMNANYSVKAKFGAVVRHTLTLEVKPSAAEGRLVIDDTGDYAGQDQPSARSFLVREGTTVNLSAVNAPGYAFNGWEGPVLINQPDLPQTAVLMDGDKTVAVKFTGASHRVDVRALPSQAGDVSLNGGAFVKMDSAVFSYGSSVTVAARVVSGCTFLGWDLNGNGVVDAGEPTGLSHTFPVAQDMVLAALFKEPTDLGEGELSIKWFVDGSESAAGLGSYSSSVNKITIGGMVQYERIITVYPASGYEFYRWAGPDVGSFGGASETGDGGYRLVIYTTEPRTLEVHFTAPSYVLECVAVPSDKGVVTGSGTYKRGTSVIVRARTAAGSGWEFDSWRSGLSGTANPTVVTMDSDRYVLAYFREKPKNITVTVGFVPGHMGLESDRVYLGADAAGSSARPHDPIPFVIGDYQEGSEVDIGCVLGNSSIYRFVAWEGVSAHQLARGLYNASNTIRVEGNGELKVLALVRPINPMLVTRAITDDPADEDPLKVPYVSTGGRVAEGGVMTMNQSVLLWARPEEGWKIDFWGQAQVLSGVGVSMNEGSPITAADPGAYATCLAQFPMLDPADMTYSFQWLRIGAEVTEISVKFIRSDRPINPSSVDKRDLNQMDNDKTRSSSHYIHTKTND